jgi:serine/threonine-protein kinase
MSGANGHKDEGGDPASLVATRGFAGRYHVARYVGRTSAAWVYRAIHTGLAVPCFLKVAEKDEQGQLPERLRREARAAAAVRHPALLRVLDAGTHESFGYVAQEWTDGPTLRQVIERGAVVTVPELILLALDLLDGLEALHKKGILARSLEPERIFVRELPERREAKIFDLSRAYFVAEGGAAPIAERVRASAMGIVVQSARYLSPEEIREEPPDARSDLYSFGLVLYELLTGEFPFATTGSPTSFIVAHLRDVPRPLELPPERTTADLASIIRRLLAKRREDRFESALATRRAIEDQVVPDLIRYQTKEGQRVLDAWRSRVRLGISGAIKPGA